MCDQVLVLANGRVVKSISGSELTKSAIDEAVLRTTNRG
jgi:ABC-type sugar transport system ATPase subunit